LVRISLFTLFLLLSSFCYSQDIGDFDSTSIENSINFYCGKGRSTQEGKAIELARADLSEKIVTFLYSSKQVQTITSESGGAITETDYINTYTKRFSALHLIGLEKKVISTDYGYSCWVYISKTNWDKSLIELAEKVESLIASANEEFAVGNTDRAIHLYYKAYLLSYTSPKELYFRNNSGSLRLYAESSIQKIINALRLVPGVCKPDPGDDLALLLPLTVEYTGKPAKGVEVYSVIEQNWYEIVDGSIAIKIELPKLPKEQINLEVKPYFSGEDYLREIDYKYPLKFSRKVDVDFSPVIKKDFTISIKNGVLTCEPEVENLNVVDIDWFYGDGKKYSGTTLKADASKSKYVSVTMRINNSEDLSLTKTIPNPDGNEPVIEKPKETVQEKPLEKPIEVAKDIPTPKVDPPSNPTTTPNLQPSINGEKVIPSIIGVKDNWNLLNQLLKDYKAKGYILLGKKNDFTDPSKCHILVFDSAAGVTVAILEPGEKSRKDILSGEVIEEIVTKYKGKTPIWFQIL